MEAGYEVLGTLLELSNDGSAHVRRASLQALVHLFQIVPAQLKKHNAAEILANRCRDESMLVRKEMVHGLDHLLDLITEDEVMEACWLNGVVPRVRDPEAMVQKKALEVRITNRLWTRRRKICPRKFL